MPLPPLSSISTPFSPAQPKWARALASMAGALTSLATVLPLSLKLCTTLERRLPDASRNRAKELEEKPCSKKQQRHTGSVRCHDPMDEVED